MKIFYLESGLDYSTDMNEACRAFIEDIGKALGSPIEIADKRSIADEPRPIVFIGTGGTEGMFRRVFASSPAKEWLILTNGRNNSLAASLEILAYLKGSGLSGEIIHGEADRIAARLSSITNIDRAKKRLKGMRLGQIGAPSDWLIASGADRPALSSRLGLDIIDISIDELMNEYGKKSYEETECTRDFLAHAFDPAEKEKALYLYGAASRIAKSYALGGLTIRCFDLLKPLGTTGCAALALLNADGIYAGCEGDMPALVSMTVAGELTGEPCFLCNPSQIDTENNSIILAHCTLPADMPESYTLDTHFESGIGVALAGHIREGEATVFKLSRDAGRYFASDAVITENLSRRTLCRTQIRLTLDKSVSYFLTDPICNHHIVIKGANAALFDEFFKSV